VAVRGKHGAMLAGRYRLLEQLGEGGMGSVWKAEHLVLHSQVAIKIIDPEVARLEFNLARFLREAKTLASLRSPHVVQVLDFGSDADTPYLVMELLQGQTLGRRLSDQGRLSLGEMSRIMKDVCAAMALVHEQGLIHRDLKPENIFLCGVGEQQITKIVDFGIAKSLRGDMSASMKTRTGHMLGTPSYMSPEQCRGLKDIDHRADLWALGVIVYECLSGKVPFEGEVLGDLLLRICMDPLPVPSQKVQGALPSGFDGWFAKAVARDRAERFQSAHELSVALEALARSVEPGASLAEREAPTAGLAGTAIAGAALGRAAAAGAASAGAASAGAASAGAASAGAASAGAASAGAASAGAARSAPAAAAAPLSQPAHRPPTNTETNTTVGLVNPARNADRRARLAALAAVAIAAGLAWWELDGDSPADPPVSVDVQSLRPPYEVTPKYIRPSVPSGRRWTPTRAEPARAPAPASPGGDSADPMGAPSEAPPAPEAPPPEADPSGVRKDPAAAPPDDAPAPLRGTSAPGTPVRHHPVKPGPIELRPTR
jgi:eukaryotic-like serine/threonine-protein kinase